MRKLMALLVLVTGFQLSVNSQLTLYTFSHNNGTYTSITGTTATVSALTDGVTAILPIGFNFWYNGTTYTQFGASTNGKIRLGGVLTAAEENFGGTLSNHPERPLIAPLFDHLKLSAATGLTYQTSGTAPNRILTVQWANVFWPASEISAGIEFQVKLYETTNRIEFIYKPLAGSNFGAFAFIGICAVPTGSGNFLALTDTGVNPSVSSTSSTIIQVKPANGKTYVFMPPASCTAPPTGGTTVSSNTSICNGFNFTLSVTGASEADLGLTYQWQKSADGTTGWTDIASATNKTLTTSQTAATFYRRAIICATVTDYSTPLQVQSGSAPATYATIPYLQDFNSTWLSNCQTRELPSLNWRNTPLTGDRSWRREDDNAAGGWTDNTGVPTTTGNTTHVARFHIRDNFSGPPPTTGDLDLYVNCSPAGTKELRFKHYQSNYATKLQVYYSTDGGTNFTLLTEVRGVGEWHEVNYILPSNSATTIVRFRGTSEPFSPSSDHAIDDVQVLSVSCLPPTGLTVSNVQQNSAIVLWNTVAGALGYEYAFSSGFGAAQPPASGTFTTDLSQTINGLTAGTNYWIHVRTKCGTSSFSSWSSIFITTSVDCGTAIPIACGTPTAVTLADGSGKYDLYESDPGGSCGRVTFGTEKFLLFKPQVTGTYSLSTTGNPGGYDIHYFIKDAAGTCSPIGWTCIGSTINAQTFTLGTLTAGKEYYILIDMFTIINGHTETINISCTAVNPDCVNATISPATASICTGSSQLLTTSGGTAYQWFRNGVLISGATQSTYSATQGGTYTVAVTNGTCTKISTNSSVITETTVLAPTISGSGPATFCEGNSVTFTSSAASSNQWYKDGSIITGATNTTYVANQSGSYIVKTTSAGCTSAASNVIIVTVNANPVVPVITAGTTTFCQGGNVVLSTTVVSGISYQWLKENAAISGANSNSYSATESGSYTLRVFNVANCNVTSAATVVTVNPLPAKPTISVTSNILTSSSATGNQWFLEGVSISGATSQNYTAVASGNYTVQVTQNGCSTLSDPLNYIITAIVDPATWNNEISLFPNPTSDRLYIGNSGTRRLSYRFIDATGRTVLEIKPPVVANDISLKKLGAGVYLLLITDIKKGETIVKRIMKK